MKLNRDVLLQSMLKHQRVFLQLLDYMQQHETGYEVPETLYLQLYAKHISGDADENVASHLALDTLVANGVVVHNDRTTGMLSFERVVVDLFRFIDVKRQRELTRADFESMRSQFYAATLQVQASRFLSEDYHEAMQSMLQVLSEIHSKIRQNVAALEAQADDVAVRYQRMQEPGSAESMTVLYTQVSKLYDRYVLPCLEFINPSMQMQQTLTYSQCLDALMDYHAQHDATVIAQNLRYRRIAISSYYKDIQRVKQRVQHYFQILSSDRDNYLAIEAAFQLLQEELLPLRHGKRRYRFFDAASEFFAGFRSFTGIAHLRRGGAARINWPDQQQSGRVHEFLRSRSSGGEKAEEPLLQPVSAAPDLDLLRQKQIFSALISHQWPSQMDDVFRYLDSVLREVFDDYSLVDTLYGYDAFLALTEDREIVYTGARYRLTDNRYYFDYLIPAVKELAHV
ncbi:hypothetical protein IDAT_10260 [Pseudidiomarina atlantica]|uniref:Uncharacterized protein n=1 Tax=Pseudidiomarina atlantica TaxID=1517416 RepID=A0A094J6J4_9GAMM|nr:hypothetical protein [Pseudidiomarina atlantica]KFZ28211.1 hypothetical protein IDAT_10260 [Pseudidiomarina atlantica]